MQQTELRPQLCRTLKSAHLCIEFLGERLDLVLYLCFPLHNVVDNEVQFGHVTPCVFQGFRHRVHLSVRNYGGYQGFTYVFLF